MFGETPSRRTVLKRTVATVAGIATAFGIGYAGTGPSAALESDDEFLASDVRIERNDGTIRAVTVAPELQLRWTNFGGGLTVDVTLSAAIDGEPGFDVLFDGSVQDEAVTVDGDDFGSPTGTATIAFDRTDVTAVGSDVTADDFGGDLAPGESRTTAVELTLRVDFVGDQEETVTAVETAVFEVTVHNPVGDATTRGRANAEAE